MAKETIDAIREAETQARLHEDEARVQAGERIKKAQMEAQIFYDNSIAAEKELEKRATEEAHMKAQAYIDDAQKNTLTQVQAMKDAAGNKTAQVIKEILAGL